MSQVLLVAGGAVVAVVLVGVFLAVTRRRRGSGKPALGGYRVEGTAATAGAAGAAVGAAALVAMLAKGFGTLAVVVVGVMFALIFATTAPDRLLRTSRGQWLGNAWTLAALSLVLLITAFVGASLVGPVAGLLIFALSMALLLAAAARASGT